MMAGLLDSLARAAEQEGRTGSLGNSVLLSKSARELHDSIRALRRAGVPEKEQRENLAGLLDGLTRSFSAAKSMSAENAVPFLEKNLSRLLETRKYLDFLKRNPDAAGRIETEKEATFLLRQLSGALNGIGRGGATVTGPMNTERLSKLVDEALKHPGSTEQLSPVIDHLEKFVAGMKISVRAHAFQPDEIPEKYREEARLYFERLSRQEEVKQ